jgi:hypothetical protein
VYGLSADVDLSFLIGAVLIQVCVGENEVILNFDSEVSIMSAASVRYGGAGAMPETIDTAQGAGRALIGLLGQGVVSAEGSDDGTLRVLWSAGDRVEFLASWKEYESYTIRHGETLIVV